MTYADDYDDTFVARNPLDIDPDELDIDDLWDIMDSGIATTSDGCQVEPDGICPHGKRSPLLELGLI